MWVCRNSRQVEVERDEGRNQAKDLRTRLAQLRESLSNERWRTMIETTLV